MKRFEFGLKRVDLGQYPLGQAQNALACRRQLQRFGATHKQFHPGLIFQPLDLVTQGRLRDMQDVCRFLQSTRIMDRLDRAEMTELDMHL